MKKGEIKMSNKKSKISNNNDENKNENFAVVPYNFIKLNSHVVFHDYKPNLDTYNQNTGYIECELESKSLFIIGDAGDTEINFYSINNKPVIPGSTLRGMFRNYHQIISCSKIQEINDIYLYYRSFASISDKWKNEYNSDIISKDKNKLIVKAGALVKNGYKYTISEVKYNVIRDETKILEIFKNVNKIDRNVKKMNEKIWNKLKFKRFQLDNKYYITSGMMEKKCTLYELDIENISDEKIIVNEIDINSYLNDKNRKGHKNREGHKNIVKLANDNEGENIYCFYLQFKDNSGNERISIGNIPKMRRVYKEKIGSLVPDDHKIDKIDMNMAIFGYVFNGKALSGRVSFEDAYFNYYNKSESFRKIALFVPKPTSIQLYLEQPKDYNYNNIKTYNDKNARIRGHKLYWHKNIQKYNTNNKNIDKKIKPIKEGAKADKKIKPIKEGAKARFKIWFENLSDVELGSLLYIFKLVDDNHLLKLGMGKPLGYGSIFVSAKLFLSDRKKRYTKIFDDNKLYLPYEEKDIEKDKDGYIAKFEKYMKEKLKDNYSEDFESRINSLKIMMNKTIGFELDKQHIIEYKDVKDDQFKKLYVLLNPENMKNKVKTD